MGIEDEKKREAAYWRGRMSMVNSSNARLSRETYAEIEKAFELAQKDIQRDIDAWMNRFAKNNGVSLVEAKKLLNSDELKEFRWDVEEYAKHARENAVNGKWVKELENASARVHISRLEALKIRTQNHLETAFGIENRAVESMVKDAYKNGYYRTCYELQKGFNAGFDIAGIDEKKLDMIAKKPWTVDRRTFSDRIWERKDKMVSALHQEMIRNCIYGRSQKDMTKAMMQFVGKDIKNAEYCAARLVKTECAFFTSASQFQGLSDLDCEMYEVYLPIGEKSCEICKEMNGRHFKMSEYEPGMTAPPFHPNCENGSIIPYYEDDLFGMTGGGKKIPDDMTYPEWEKKFVKGNGLTNSGESGTIKENHDKEGTDMSLKNSIIQRPHRKEILDVTDEYLLSATPSQGSVTYDKGYEIGKHRDEIKMSDWLFKTFGGEIKLLKESGIKNQKTPDYLWNDKYWELKGARSISSADKLLQRAIKQIQKPYGGVIMNILEDIDLAALEEQLVRRIDRSGIENLDIMILAKGEFVKIFRYKK